MKRAHQRVPSAADTPTKVVVRVKVAGLKPHPRQAHHFDELPEARLRDLAGQMGRGLDRPIEVLRDFTIICGHQRVRAAKLLGWAEIDVVFRDDLETLGPAAVEERLIRDNLDGRQLNPLAVARCYFALKQLEAGSRRGRPSGDERKELRDQIGEQLGLSGRTLDRYLRVLQTPVEVQRAVSAGCLGLVMAGQVAGLPAATQEEIAKQIREGVEAAAAVAALLPEGARPSRRCWTVLADFVRGLRRGLASLEGRLDEIKHVGAHDRVVLRRAQEVLELLLAMAGDDDDADGDAPAAGAAATRGEPDGNQKSGGCDEGAPAAGHDVRRRRRAEGQG